MQHSSTPDPNLIARGGRSKTIRAMLFTLVLFAAGFVAAMAYLALSTDSQISPIGQAPSTGWQLLDQEKSADRVSIQVHHVVATHNGIHVIYSAKANATSGQLTSDVVARRVTDGTMTDDSIEDRLVATDGVTAIRIVSLGKPVPGTTKYGMNLTGFDADDGMGGISIDIISDETPTVIEDDISLVSHPDPEVTNLLYGGYSVIGPNGTTFGILPGRVISAEHTPAYFMIAPGGMIREITFEELVAFNERHTR